MNSSESTNAFLLKVLQVMRESGGDVATAICETEAGPITFRIILVDGPLLPEEKQKCN